MFKDQSLEEYLFQDQFQFQLQFLIKSLLLEKSLFQSQAKKIEELKF